MYKIVKIMLCLLLLNSISEAQIIKENWVHENSFMTRNDDCTHRLLQDRQGRIWVHTYTELFSKNSYEDTVWYNHTELLYENLKLNSGLVYLSPYEFCDDIHGNLLFSSVKALAICYENNEWDYYDNKDNKLFALPKGIEYSPTDDRIYAFGREVDTMFYLQYNPETKRYGELCKIAVDTCGFENEVIDLVMTNADTELMATSHNKIGFYNLNTQIWNLIEPEIDNQSDFDLKDALATCNIRQNLWSEKTKKVYALQTIDSSRFTQDTSIDLYYLNIVEFDYQDNKLIRTNVTKLNKDVKAARNPKWCWLDEDKDSIIIGSYSEIWIYDIHDHSISKIPIPAELGEDLNQDWTANDFLVFPEKNEIWIGSVQGGIFVCNLDALINSAQPVGVTESVEYNPYLPVLMVKAVFPNPATGFVNIDFFQQLGTVKDLDVKLYNTNGMEMQNVEIEVQQFNGMQNRCTVTTSNLITGVYIVHIKYLEHDLSVKFIVN